MLEENLNSHMQSLMRVALGRTEHVTKLTLLFALKQAKRTLGSLTKDKEKEGSKKHGEQSLSELNKHNQKLRVIEIKNGDIDKVRAMMNQYAIDFNVHLINGNLEITFKAIDEERAIKGLEKVIPELEKEIKEKYTEKEISRAERGLIKGNLKDKVEKAEKKAKEHNEQVRNEKVKGIEKEKPAKQKPNLER